MASIDVLRSSSTFAPRRQSSPDTITFPRLIPEVKESNVVMSGLLEVQGLPSGSSELTTTSLGHHRPPRPSRLGGGQKVIVCIYKTSREHFAVVYPLKMMISARKPIASINLKTSLVDKLNEESFRVEPGKEKKPGQSDKLVFKLLASQRLSPDSGHELDRWVEAFGSSNLNCSEGLLLSRSPTAVYTPVMATLAEMSEDIAGEQKG